jgi:ParB family chromosome partitioning protein
MSARRALTIDDPVAAGSDRAAASEAGRLRELQLDVIRPNPDQPRKLFDEDALRLLADSIAERGVLQPIIVRPAEGSGFELVAGERRWRAAKLAGLAAVPALVDEAVEGAGSLEVALIENVAWQDLTAIEEARTIAVLRGDLGVSDGDLARRLGRSRTDLVTRSGCLICPTRRSS